MSASNVRRGKAYERRIVNALNGISQHFKYRRRIVTGHSASIVDVESVGDIISINGKLRFVLEMKNQAGFSLEAILNLGDKSKFFSWWTQCLRDVGIAKNPDLEPMVFFASRTTNMVAMSYEGFSRLFLQPVPHLIIGSGVFSSYGKPIIIVTLNEFLSKCDVDALCVQSDGDACVATMPQGQ